MINRLKRKFYNFHFVDFTLFAQTKLLGENEATGCLHSDGRFSSSREKCLKSFWTLSVLYLMHVCLCNITRNKKLDISMSLSNLVNKKQIICVY